jgi:phage terminase large subunit-like protein
LRAGAGKLERLAYERNERDLALTRQPGGHPRGLVFDAEAGERVVRFIEGYCRHHKGEWNGRALLLEPWQKWLIRTLFGWRRADGTRRFRKAWIEIPRKNGKTELAAAIGLYLLIADGEAGAEVYTTATKRDQAAICHTAAREMVRASPNLARFVHVPKKEHGNLVCSRLGSKMQILASDSGTLDGLSPSGDIRDEVHQWKDPRLAGVLDTATGARRQPMTVEITTAGVYDVEAVGWQHHEYAMHVLQGAFEDDRTFAFIAAIDEEDDPWAEDVWRKANPNLGISPKLDYIREQVEEARRLPHKQNEILRDHFNRWTQQVTRWLPIDNWNACYREDLDVASLAGRECVGGLDLSSTNDLTAFVLLFEQPDGTIDALSRFWLPEETVEAAIKKGMRHYEQWAKEGLLRTTPGNVVDYDFIRAEVGELGKQYEIREIAFDPYNATQMSNDLQADGFLLVKTRQGFTTLSEPSKLLEVKVLSGKFRHNSPVLRWNGLNASIDTDAAGNIKPVKDVKRANKIDGIAATVTALSRLVQAEESATPGVVIL